jgi:hypothetical protein
MRASALLTLNDLEDIARQETFVGNTEKQNGINCIVQRFPFLLDPGRVCA